MKTTNHQSDAGPSSIESEPETAPIALLIARGQYAKPCIAAPGGTTLGVGDRWPLAGDGGMQVTAEMRDGELRISLALRIEGFDSVDWQAFAGIPAIVALLATPPVVWFMVEISGLHCRAPLLIGHDRVQAAAIRKLIEEPDVARSITLFGIANDTVQAIKVGITCDRVFEMLAEAIQDSEATPSRATYVGILNEGARHDAGAMFAEAMRRHLLTRPASA